MKWSLIAVVVLLLSVSMVSAQEVEVEVFVEDLLSPRNMSFGADGLLYVAEAGAGGDQLSLNDDPFGSTSRISRVDTDGARTTVVRGLTSYRNNNSLGAHAVLATNDSIWFAIGETSDTSIPWSNALVDINPETGRVQNFIDLLTLELTEDPDGNPSGESNPTDFAVAQDGGVIIANAGCNCLMRYHPEDGLSVLVAWDFATDNPVPAAVEIGVDGSIYVGFLTGFPFPEGGSRIERWLDGELIATYEGLTAVTGLAVIDETEIYAVEHGVFGQGWGPGRVVRVSPEGVTPVVENLDAPFGIVEGLDGNLYVSVGSRGGDGGAIIRFPKP